MTLQYFIPLRRLPLPLLLSRAVLVYSLILCVIRPLRSHTRSLTPLALLDYRAQEFKVAHLLLGKRLFRQLEGVVFLQPQIHRLLQIDLDLLTRVRVQNLNLVGSVSHLQSVLRILVYGTRAILVDGVQERHIGDIPLLLSCFLPHAGVICERVVGIAVSLPF